MTPRHAICLVVDGLRASALGTYGNTSYPTPQFDALASRSLVADWMLADSPSLEGFYRGVWQGVHALRPADDRESVLQQLQKTAVRQWLVTDEPWMIEQATSLPFDDTLLFENEADSSAETVEDSTLGRFFFETVERLNQWREDVEGTGSLAWLHCRGLYGPWDALQAFRDELLDDEDPAASDFVQPPMAHRDIDDPDVLLQYRTAYAAQVTLLDACIGAFIQAVEESFDGCDTLVMLTSSRGFALGEHGSVGCDCAELYGERMHLPWIVYPCGNATPLPRVGPLMQPADIGQTLRDWFGLEQTKELCDGISCLSTLGGTACEQRQLVVASSGDRERVVRTPAWMLRSNDSGTEQESLELFTKPDDRWESNDVAGLCPNVVEQFKTVLADYEQCCNCGKSLPLCPSDDGLIVPSR